MKAILKNTKTGEEVTISVDRNNDDSFEQITLKCLEEVKNKGWDKTQVKVEIAWT